MAELKNYKIADADFAQKDITSIEENVVSGQADWLKKQFDKASKEVIAPRLNGLIDRLESEQAADNLGAEALAPDGAQTVGGQLRYLNEQLKKAVVGQIPDASITQDKLSEQFQAVLAAKLSGDFSNATGTLAVANGGTGATAAAAARQNLGAAPSGYGIGENLGRGAENGSIEMLTGHNDWDCAAPGGFYSANNAANAPATGWFVGVTMELDSNYYAQIVSSVSTHDLYYRVRTDGVFLPWKKIITSALMTYGTDEPPASGTPGSIYFKIVG